MTSGVGHGKIHLQQQPTAESEVAISFSGWTASSCPHGGSHHLKVTYAFLPSDPVSCSVAKASADDQWSARDRDDPSRCYRTILEQTSAFSVTLGPYDPAGSCHSL